jgi:4-amino-4-deoxy-L-arabinose transferase-like glycosyltransferase
MAAISNHTRRTLTLALIVLAYLVIGALYAALTPEWQVPDEPAHYNYIQQLAGGTWPVIEPGDYDQAYLEKLKTEGFPPDQTTDGIQYEDHQPPLYYLLATPLFWLADGGLLPLRLFSLLLGAGVIIITYRIGQRLFPSRPIVVLTASSVVAFVPQHIAMMAGVNNDSLSELLVALALLASVLVLEAERPPAPWLLGLLIAAILITKIQAYVAVPLVGLAGLARWRRDALKGWRWFAGWLLCVYGPALVIGGLWWARNLSTYGGLDWMGLDRHDLVVAGQPTTAEWIAEHGLLATFKRFSQFTFQSFWGMFGWMAVPMDARAYQGVGIWTAMTASGFVAAVSAWRRSRRPRGPTGLARSSTLLASPVALLLAASAVFTVAGYLWWNLSYVQHQGRYLFPALIPLALAAGIAWEQLTLPRPARLTAAVMPLVAALAAAVGNRWAAVMWAGAAVLVGLSSLLPRRLRWLLPATASAGLALLSGAGVFWYVLPWLD